MTASSSLKLSALVATVALLAPHNALADEPPDLSPEAVAQEGGAEGDVAAAPTEGEEAEESDGPSRRDTRVKDHALGFGYYFTHMQWANRETGATPQVNYHAMAVRYAYYIGQGEGFGFMINAAATVPSAARQSGVTAIGRTRFSVSASLPDSIGGRYRISLVARNSE